MQQPCSQQAWPGSCQRYGCHTVAPVLAAGAAVPLATLVCVPVVAADASAVAATDAAAAAPADDIAAGFAVGFGFSAPSASESANMSSPSLSANMSLSAASTAGLLANMLAALAKSACTDMIAGEFVVSGTLTCWVGATQLQLHLNAIQVAYIPIDSGGHGQHREALSMTVHT
jgi:hypothetical protein